MIIEGDCLEIMRTMEDNSIDFIVTDPPYGLHFMGKDWDGCIPAIEIWEEALRICKPGSMLAAFGGSRTHHHLMCAIESAGWQIRDVIMWIYGSGFPKSHNKFGLNGYGTALKPAYEPIIIAMKPLDGTFAQNAEKWGLSGINVDDSRIGLEGATKRSKQAEYPKNEDGSEDRSQHWARTGHNIECMNKGRWPSNLILDEEAAEQLGSPSRFFYCAKASSKERGKENNHPTVKPLALMSYLIRLLAPPGKPKLLDPFAGSGSTLLAAKELGIDAIGIEQSPEYCEIANKRIA